MRETRAVTEVDPEDTPSRRELVLHLPHAAMTLLGSVVLLWIWLATSPRRARRRGPPPLAN